VNKGCDHSVNNESCCIENRFLIMVIAGIYQEHFGSYVNLKLRILATLCDVSFTSVTN